VVVCQLSRGIGPGIPIVEMQRQAHRYGWAYEYLTGLPLVEGKNRAVELAITMDHDLLLVEDDIRVPPEFWHVFIEMLFVKPDAIIAAETNTRQGRKNTKRTRAGVFLATGNVFTRIPLAIMHRMARPLFRSWNFAMTTDGDELSDRGPSNSGDHSDFYFWYHARHLAPPPEIIMAGEVKHMKHPLNSGETNHSDPYVEAYF